MVIYERGRTLNRKLKIVIPLFIVAVVVGAYMASTSIRENPAVAALKLFSVDKTIVESGPWAGIQNLTIRYNGNETLQDTVSIQIHDLNTGHELMVPQTFLYVQPGWNFTMAVEKDVVPVVTVTYKGEAAKWSK